VGVSLFAMGNVVTTLLILPATQRLTPSFGRQAATQLAIGIYAAYNVAAAVASPRAGRLSDRWRPVGMLAAGAFFLLLAYLGFATTASGPSVLTGALSWPGWVSAG
jgi:predicted MFS family arabinose efflux permease